MKKFVAVVSHDAGRITKFLDFDTQVEADAHVARFGGKVVTGIDDDLAYWDVSADPVKNTAALVADSSRRNVMSEIRRLESEVTQRRLREAALGTDGGWLANQEALIAAERSKL